jgi:hypothetical protein
VYEGISCGWVGDKIMYRDREKQKAANREHAKAYRMRKGMTQGMTIKGEGMTESIIPTIIPVIPLVTIENVKKVAAGLVSNQDWRKPKTPESVRRFGENPKAA